MAFTHQGAPAQGAATGEEGGAPLREPGRPSPRVSSRCPASGCPRHSLSPGPGGSPRPRTEAAEGPGGEQGPPAAPLRGAARCGVTSARGGDRPSAARAPAREGVLPPGQLEHQKPPHVSIEIRRKNKYCLKCNQCLSCLDNPGTCFHWLTQGHPPPCSYPGSVKQKRICQWHLSV